MSKANQRIAAEKHFIKLETEYRKKIAQLVNEKKELKQENAVLKNQNQALESQVMQSEEWIERLLGYTELKLEDIQAVCAADKKKGALFDMFAALTGVCRL